MTAPLTLRNPHSVLAALKNRPGSVASVAPPAGRPTPAWAAVLDAAAGANVPVVSETAPSGGRRSKRRDDRDDRGGGGSARVAPVSPVSLDRLFAGADPDAPGLWLALDRIQDVHNLGAIFRGAAFFGVRGVVLTRDQSAPLTAAAYDVACGGVEAVPHAAPVNLASALKAAKAAGLWVLGTSEHAAGRSVFDVDRDRPWLVAVGNEEKGLRKRTLDTCDEVCGLPPAGGVVTSLNASVACGAVLAALARPSER